MDSHRDTLGSAQENTYCQQKGLRKHGKPLRMLHISNRRQPTCDFSYLLFLSYLPDISYMCTFILCECSPSCSRTINLNASQKAGLVTM